MCELLSLPTFEALGVALLPASSGGTWLEGGERALC